MNSGPGPSGSAGLEIVERRGGKWYSNRRSFEKMDWPGMHRWVDDHGRGSRYQTRWVYPLDPFLSASDDWQRQQTFGERSTRPVLTEDKARNQGYQLANALGTLFVVRGGDTAGALYGLARNLAAMSGEYEVADTRDAFIEGFLNGWKNARTLEIPSGVPSNPTSPTEAIPL